MEITFAILAAFAIWRLFETGEIFVGAALVGAAAFVLGIVWLLLMSSPETLTFWALIIPAFAALIFFLSRREVARERERREKWVIEGCPPIQPRQRRLTTWGRKLLQGRSLRA